MSVSEDHERKTREDEDISETMSASEDHERKKREDDMDSLDTFEARRGQRKTVMIKITLISFEKYSVRSREDSFPCFQREHAVENRV